MSVLLPNLAEKKLSVKFCLSSTTQLADSFCCLEEWRMENKRPTNMKLTWFERNSCISKDKRV